MALQVAMLVAVSCGYACGDASGCVGGTAGGCASLPNPTLIIIKNSYKIIKILLSKKRNIDIVHFMTNIIMEYRD